MSSPIESLTYHFFCKEGYHSLLFSVTRSTSLHGLVCSNVCNYIHIIDQSRETSTNSGNARFCKM